MQERKGLTLRHERRQSPMHLGIYSASIFQALIRHERNRVNRDGNSFSLVAFKLQADRPASFSGSGLRELIKKEMRLVDEIGWLDKSAIGVLLPSTEMNGGLRFAGRVSGASLASGHPLTYDVYSYPHQWIPYNFDETDTIKLSEPDEAKEHEKKLHSIFNLRIPAWKRVLDVGFSVAALILLSPLFAVVAAYIKLVSPGPVFFKQYRVGYGGKPFLFIKFRSMKHGNDQGTHQNHIVTKIRSNNPMLKLDSHDPRIIPGGRFLRKSCIDELPQLFNVLRGEMSLVGPRPCLPYEAKEFMRWHNHRFDVLPGMTGLWQVSGKNKLTFLQMIRLDISYANNMSLFYDISIIFRTIPVIVELVMEKVADKLKQQIALAPEKEEREEAVL